MIAPYTLDPHAWFDDAALVKTLGLKVGSLDKARRSGELKYTRKGGRVLYLGRWVHQWLTHDEAPQREAQPCAVAG